VALYALDASVVLALFLKEDQSLVNEFWMSLTPDDQVFGAQVLLPECTSVIQENVFKGRMTVGEGETAVADLIALPITTTVEREQFPRAVALAERFRRVKAYDMQYLAIAEMTGSELVTIDGGMRQAAMEIGQRVRFLR
jgi:predicted nucleic acid-binding protein